MNSELIKFIEICLIDGVISDKEKEVIFRKSEELGVPKDECEIILEGMMIKNNDKVEPKLVSNGNQKEESKSVSKDNGKPPLLDDKQIGEILNLDYEILSDFTEYINKLEVELKKITNPKFINECFHNWYKDLPKNLIKGKTKFTSLNPAKYGAPPGDAFFYKDTSCTVKFEMNILTEIKDFYYPEKLDFDLEKDEKIIGYINEPYSKLGATLLSSKRIFNFYNKKRLFGGYDWFYDPLKNVSEIDIFDANNEDFLTRCYTVIRKFTRELSFYQTFFTQFKNININFNSKEGLKYLPNEPLFGDDLVVKMSNYVQNLVNSFLKDISTSSIVREVPYFLDKKGLRANKRFQQMLDINLYQIKNISSMIKFRNELILAVLSNDRSTIMLIKEQMDEMGILLNHFEEKKLEKMDDMVDAVKQASSILSSGLSAISDSVSSLNSTVSSGFNEVNSNLRFNNLLGVIQAYQAYKINKNTKSLK